MLAKLKKKKFFICVGKFVQSYVKRRRWFLWQNCGSKNLFYLKLNFYGKQE